MNRLPQQQAVPRHGTGILGKIEEHQPGVRRFHGRSLHAVLAARSESHLLQPGKCFLRRRVSPVSRFLHPDVRGVEVTRDDEILREELRHCILRLHHVLQRTGAEQPVRFERIPRNPPAVVAHDRKIEHRGGVVLVGRLPHPVSRPEGVGGRTPAEQVPDGKLVLGENVPGVRLARDDERLPHLVQRVGLHDERRLGRRAVFLEDRTVALFLCRQGRGKEEGEQDSRGQCRDAGAPEQRGEVQAGGESGAEGWRHSYLRASIGSRLAAFHAG